MAEKTATETVSIQCSNRACAVKLRVSAAKTGAVRCPKCKQVTQRAAKAPAVQRQLATPPAPLAPAVISPKKTDEIRKPEMRTFMARPSVWRSRQGNWGKIACCIVIALSIVVIATKLLQRGERNVEVAATKPQIPPEMLSQLTRLRAKAEATQSPPTALLSAEELWKDVHAAVGVRNGRKALERMLEILHTKPKSTDECLSVLCEICQNPLEFHVDDAGIQKLLSDPDALPLIDSGMQGTLDPVIRQHLIRALSWNSGAQAEAILIRELARPQDAKCLSECIRALDGRDSPAVRQALAECLNSPTVDFGFRMSAAAALGRMQSPAVDEVLAATARDDKDPAVRETTLHILQTRYPPTPGILVTRISPLPDDETFRKAVAPMLGMELLPSDVLVACNGVSYKSTQEILNAITDSKEQGDAFNVEVFRGGKSVEIKATGAQVAFALSRVHGAYVTPNKEAAAPAVKAVLDGTRSDAGF